jgi:hypothetical protein
MVRSALVKPVTARLKVMVTSEVSPIFSAVSDTTMVAAGGSTYAVLRVPPLLKIAAKAVGDAPVEPPPWAAARAAAGGVAADGGEVGGGDQHRAALVPDGADAAPGDPAVAGVAALAAAAATAAARTDVVADDDVPTIFRVPLAAL